MIRINLLGQVRPKATKSAVPVEGMLQLVMPLIALGAALVVLAIIYYQHKSSLDATNNKIQQLRVEKASLEQVKQDVDRFETEKSTLQQRIDVIENLQKNRSGGQDLLRMVANTVVRVDSLWLTSMSRTAAVSALSGSTSAAVPLLPSIVILSIFSCLPSCTRLSFPNTSVSPPAAD